MPTILSTLTLGSGLVMSQGMTLGNQSNELYDLRVKPSRADKSRAKPLALDVRAAKGLSGVCTAAEAALVLVHT